MSENEFDAHEERLVGLWLDDRNQNSYQGSFERWMIERVVKMEEIMKAAKELSATVKR